VILGLIVLAAVAILAWDVFLRGRRGRAIAWSVAAMLALGAAAIAGGADVDEPWPLIGLIVGMVLFGVALARDRRAPG